MKYAIIDVGSNTIRMNVYAVDDGNIKEIFSRKNVAGLSSYLEKGILTPRGIKKLTKTLNSYKSMAELIQVQEILPFATASIRNATNQKEILDRVTEETGLKLELLPGEIEAYYGYLGLTMNTDVEKSGLVFDIGGGSTELIRFEKDKITDAISLPIGSLNTFTLQLAALTPTESEMQTVRTMVRDALDDAGVPKNKKYPVMYGIGGTARACGNVCQDFFGLESNRIIPIDKMRSLIRHVTTGDNRALRTLLQIVPERVHTLSPGMLIMDALCERFDAKEIQVGKKGVRDGYILHIAQKKGLIK